MAGRAGQSGNWRVEEHIRRFDNDLFFPLQSEDLTIDDENAVDIPPRYDRTASRKRTATTAFPPVTPDQQ